jgi:hypothetical protein
MDCRSPAGLWAARAFQAALLSRAARRLGVWSPRPVHRTAVESPAVRIVAAGVATVPGWTLKPRLGVSRGILAAPGIPAVEYCLRRPVKLG